MLAALLCAALAIAPVDTVPPLLAFPEPGLDDPAAYQGYETRLFRDTRGNAIQIYLSRRTGRVVHVWADAADESVGFSVRDSSGAPAALAWASPGAAVTAAGSTRSIAYELEAGPAPLRIGLFLLGSMRVERDFQYQGRDSLALDSTAFPESELLQLVANLERLDAAERRRHLTLLGAATLDELRMRLAPRLRLSGGDSSWTLRVDQVSFDGRTHLSLALAGDARETEAAGSARALTVRSRAGHPVRLRVTVTTDAPALTPLARDEIFNDAFRRFYDGVRADTAHPLRFRRLEREVRGVELLSYREKLMAGLPNFATYFGRDMLMTALLMRPVWAPEMPEHVLASALGKLSPTGDVSHEEALGGQAIREHAAEYNVVLQAYRHRPSRRLLERARILLARLAATRENYIMVDDDVQLPIVAARYLADVRVPAARRRRFLREEHRLDRLLANLAFVAREATPYARHAVATNLVSFPRSPEGRWISASWRDSWAGYGGGRFAMDVNVIWMPQALAAIDTILDALAQLGLPPAALDSLQRARGRGQGVVWGPLARFVHDRAALRRAVAVWRGAERRFQVTLGPEEMTTRIAARLGALPQPEADFWGRIWRATDTVRDTLRFLALALDADGRPIPIVNTDPAMLLLLEPLAAARVRELVSPLVRPYPVGLFVDELGPLVANDAYAAPAVWEAFRRDAYHSPTVVWGRDVNVLLAGLALQIRAARPGSDLAPLEDALQRTITAVDRSGLRHAELWTYTIENGRLVPARYGTSSDVQLWSLTDLAVQYLLTHPVP